MSLSNRDRKIVFAVVPVVLVIAFWFLMLSPKREEARVAAEALTEQVERRDAAIAKLRQAAATKEGFAADYASMVRLGKAVPSNVDTPSLLVQLDKAARGTEIVFKSVKAGTPSEDSSEAPAPGGAAPGGSGSGAPAGGAPAGGSGAPAAGAPAAGSGGAATGAAPAGGGAAPPGLETVPLEFEFVGSYFDLASFFHRMKRFVYVDEDRIEVKGRLLTIDSVKLLDKSVEPGLNAEIKASVYLSPKAEGPTAGASPEGPAETQSASSPGTSTTASSTP